MNPCCCSAPTPSVCDICSEGSNVYIERGNGFVIDGAQFSAVTDIYPQATSIPGGCVDHTGHSTVCSDVLNREWSLSYLSVGHRPDATCVDYFGNEIACDAVTCWWYGAFYIICPDVCQFAGQSCSVVDKTTAEIIVDASSDPVYVLMYIQVSIQWLHHWCCQYGYVTGAPYSKMRVSYRVPKTAFTCLCDLCFEKFNTELIHDSPTGEGIPCLNFPDHLRVSPRANGDTPEQLAEANAHCGSPDYQVNIDCAVPEGCGHTLCTYEAQDTGGSLEWVYVSGICIEGCICPDHAGLIAAGFPQPKYIGQALSVDTDCVTGDRPCSIILGRCCYVDETGVHCVDDIDECDCYADHGGCWDVGTGIDCAHPDAGFCTCVNPIGLCCYNDGVSGNCVDGLTEAECSTVSSGTGCWIQQAADHSDFSCANDRGGCSNCGPECNCSEPLNCGYIVIPGGSPTGYVWSLDSNGCSPGCSCPAVDDAFYVVHGYPDAETSSFGTKCKDC